MRLLRSLSASKRTARLDVLGPPQGASSFSHSLLLLRSLAPFGTAGGSCKPASAHITHICTRKQAARLGQVRRREKRSLKHHISHILYLSTVLHLSRDDRNLAIHCFSAFFLDLVFEALRVDCTYSSICTFYLSFARLRFERRCGW